jgi:hypothetical protein
VRSLSFVELRGTGGSLQHAVRDPVRVAALKAGVVVDADASEERDFLRTRAALLLGGPVSTWINRVSHLARSRAFLG